MSQLYTGYRVHRVIIDKPHPIKMAIHSDAGKNEGFPNLNTNILRNKPDMHSLVPGMNL